MYVTDEEFGVWPFLNYVLAMHAIKGRSSAYGTPKLFTPLTWFITEKKKLKLSLAHIVIISRTHDAHYKKWHNSAHLDPIKHFIPLMWSINLVL